MNTDVRHIKVSGLSVELVRKDIKNLHLGVYPPNGRVRVAVPFSVSEDAVRLAVIGKLGWIRRQQQKFETQPRQSKREMVSGESHFFQGRRYRIRVVNCDGPATVMLRNKRTMELKVRPGTNAELRLKVVERWYREQLKALTPTLLERWQPLLGVEVSRWGIKKMKTKWGSCNVDASRIWLNLELAKKPVQCLEYVIVHEMVHLIERHHNDRFTALMDRHLPHWRTYRDELNQAPLADEDWTH
ncbi:Predicted metal-dependent hydrolase [Caballeronia arationis]|uniref:Predicted metal-dependent hydrolase n=1 Tax=Caballeronia arationis TaxID=1777142 RepID=A0A7Z7I8F1_9BURK|nr:SprT family zinc-dependent metalloprotease [Caballeronia arationis]SOE81033.1 Predicted metal-dependent hydrolase [Caballeronia arationis]